MNRKADLLSESRRSEESRFSRCRVGDGANDIPMLTSLHGHAYRAKPSFVRMPISPFSTPVRRLLYLVGVRDRDFSRYEPLM